MSDNILREYEAAIVAAGRAGNLKAVSELNTAMMAELKAANPAVDAPADQSREAAKMAAKGTGVGETLAIAAGRGTDKILSGVDQLIQKARLLPRGPEAFSAAGGTPPELQDFAKNRLGELGKDQAEKDVAYGGLQQERPFTSAAGEFAPYMAVPGSAGVLGGSAIVGGLEASKYGSGNERLRAGLTGAGSNLVGGLLGNIAGKAIAPVAKGAISDTQRSALSSMDNIGVTPRLSQVTGSPFLSRIEDWAARTPGGAGVMREFGQANQQAVNRTAAQGIGETASELSPSVLASANQRMGKVFEAIKGLEGKPIQISDKVGTVADDIIRQQSKMLPTQQDPALLSLAKQAQMVSKHRGRIDGETYQLMRSGLSEASYDASGTNRTLYGKLLEALDNSADSSLRAGGNESLADALKTVRPQYANLKLLEKGAVAEAGNVSPSRLASAMRQQNPAGFREGRMEGNPLYEIAKQGEAFKPLQAGSPTYERTLMSNPLSTTIGAATSWPAAKLVTSKAAQWYPRNVGGTEMASLLGQAVNPAMRGMTMGLLNTAAGPMLLPIMPE